MNQLLITAFWLRMLSDAKKGLKSYNGPCGGRDCSTGCKCFPEKGARIWFWSLLGQFYCEVGVILNVF
uniref:Uncharacterized protein n=1 Tax=Gopherus evgoodei TaxID=1825980 RepID=A0A8C4Y9L3_9SAUR